MARIHKCLKCDFKCTEIGTFYQHKKREHGKIGRNLYETTPELQEDIEPIVDSVSHKLQCTMCAKEFSSDSDLSLHMEKIHEPSLALQVEQETPRVSNVLFKFHCMLCDKGFVEESQLSLHERDVHEIRCARCADSFYTEADLNLQLAAWQKNS